MQICDDTLNKIYHRKHIILLDFFFPLKINIKIQDGGLARTRADRSTAIREKIDPRNMPAVLFVSIEPGHGPLASRLKLTVRGALAVIIFSFQ